MHTAVHRHRSSRYIQQSRDTDRGGGAGREVTKEWLTAWARRSVRSGTYPPGSTAAPTAWTRVPPFGCFLPPAHSTSRNNTMQYVNKSYWKTINSCTVSHIHWVLLKWVILNECAQERPRGGRACCSPTCNRQTHTQTDPLVNVWIRIIIVKSKSSNLLLKIIIRIRTFTNGSAMKISKS